MLSVLWEKTIPVGFPNPPGPPRPNRYPNFGGISMKTQLAISTFALIVGLSGTTPVAAGSFNDRGLDWTMDSPMPNAAYASKPQMLPPDGSFASSWGSGKTPTQYEGSSPSPVRLTTSKQCSLNPRFGFNDSNNFPTC
jgi:hypothetical protein